jgi:UDP:flavonoid glycosyltransferase YjiC (YdhE family)
MTVQKPLVLICSTPIYGHLMPVRAIGKELVARGYNVTFVTGSAYKEGIEAIGATLIPLEGYADFTEADIEAKGPLKRSDIPAGPEQVVYDMEYLFVKPIPEQYAAQQRAMKILSEKHPGRPIVVCNEGFYMGTVPGLIGAPGIRPAGTLAIGIVPIVLRSADAPPFGPGLTPDDSPEGRARNIVMNKGVEEMFAKPSARYKQIMRELGVKKPVPFFMDATFLCPDRFLQMCIPSVEYPRRDAPPTLQFAGGLPKGHRDPFKNPPSWWSEVIENTSRKIVAVSQGSVALNFNDLVIPTLNALKDRSDVLVVVALGKKGIALPEGAVVPENARVCDFIPFDDLLPHCEVFVTNGGYGAFQHAISNGTPLIVGGAGEDKPEVAARAEWAGIGVNLHTGRPTPEEVRTAVEEIFNHGKYRARSRELEEEMKNYDPIEEVRRSIDELAAGY